MSGSTRSENGRPLWEVVGGADKGGIMVRDGKDLKSKQLTERLVTFSIIEELELNGDRLHYKLVRGKGPDEGWVSTRVGQKVLVEPQEPRQTELAKWVAPGSREESAEHILSKVGHPYEVLGLSPGASSAAVRQAYHCLALLHHPDKGGDAGVFKALVMAYKALTDARDVETGGWRDLEGQALGPWKAHAENTKGVTCMLFDCFGAPPWESRRLYTGSWQEACVRCWELSKGEPGKVPPPPRMVGEIHVGGFVNDVAALSAFGLLTAQSAGMKPNPGESLRSWNLQDTPFRPPGRASANAIKDGSRALAGGPSQALQVRDSDKLVAASDSVQPDEIDNDSMHIPEFDVSGSSTMIYLHYRGVRRISLWPRPQLGGSPPHVAATVSKDVLGVSRISQDGCGLENPAVWKRDDPHTQCDINAMRHESLEKIWTGDNSGIVKCWDVSRPVSEAVRQEPLLKVPTNKGQMTGMDVWGKAGVVVFSASDGLVFLDGRVGKEIRAQRTKNPVGCISTLHEDNPNLFAGIGPDLMQYDTRCWKNGTDEKPAAIGQWTLTSNCTAMSCTATRKGNLLVAVGCLDGKVAAFDTT